MAGNNPAYHFRDWADEQEEYPVQHNPGYYNFTIRPSLELKDRNDVMVCYMPGVGGHNEKMTGKWFEREKLLERMRCPNRYYFVPTISFPGGEGNFVIGVGKFLGEPIDDWLVKQNNIWELGSNNEVIVAGKTFGPILRMVATALRCHHKRGKPLGLSCDKVYVEGNTIKLSEPINSRNEFEGVVNDLKEFRKLVNLAGRTHTNDPNLILFDALFPSSDTEYSRKTGAELKLCSFIICHSPLLYTVRERRNYTDAYNMLRQTYGANFDNAIQLRSGIYKVVDWWKAIPSNPLDPLRQVYDHKRSYNMKSNHLLVSYLRFCYHHYYGRCNPTFFDALDEDLLKRFPDAFSKTYGEVYRKLNLQSLPLTLSELVIILKDAGLDYAEYPDELQCP